MTPTGTLSINSYLMKIGVEGYEISPVAISLAYLFKTGFEGPSAIPHFTPYYFKICSAPSSWALKEWQFPH